MAILMKKTRSKTFKSENIGAISVVDFAGNSVEMDEISNLTKNTISL